MQGLLPGGVPRAFASLRLLKDCWLACALARRHRQEVELGNEQHHDQSPDDVVEEAQVGDKATEEAKGASESVKPSGGLNPRHARRVGDNVKKDVT